MVSPSPLQIFSAKSSATSLVKFKALLQTLILSLARVISRAKSRALQILKHANYQSAIALKRNKNNILFGSFRLHYNWCSSNNTSHVMPAPDDDYSAAGDDGPQLAGYLQWLEETKGLGDRRDRKNCEDDDDEVNEIDKLAEIFIATCHEKFRLEKQESYRRFQDMIARSL